MVWRQMKARRTGTLERHAGPEVGGPAAAAPSQLVQHDGQVQVQVLPTDRLDLARDRGMPSSTGSCRRTAGCHPRRWRWMRRARRSSPSSICVINVLACDRRSPIGAKTAAACSRRASACERSPWTRSRSRRRTGRTSTSGPLRRCSRPTAHRATGRRSAHRARSGRCWTTAGRGSRLRGAGVRRRSPVSRLRMPAFRNALTSATPACPDPPHPLHQRRVRDLVEARRDVALHHPLVVAWVGREVAHLGDRVGAHACQGGTHTSTERSPPRDRPSTSFKEACSALSVTVGIPNRRR